MEIKLSPQISQKPLNAAELKPLVESWRAGQIIKATVVESPDKQTLVVKIGDKTVVAQTQGTTLPFSLDKFKPQQIIELKVVRVGEQTTLALKTAPPSETGTNDALRQALPRQQSLSPLLNSLDALRNWPQTKLSAPLKTVQDLAQQIVQLLPQPKDLNTAQGVKTAILNSGPWLEQKLAAASKTVGQPGQGKSAATDATQNDLKANLNRLVAVLREAAIPRSAAGTPSAGTTNTTGIASLGPLLAAGARLANPLNITGPATPSAEDIELKLTKTPVDIAPPVRGMPPQPQARVPTAMETDWPFERLVMSLLEQAEGALSRVRVNQLSQTVEQPPNTQAWTVEIPVKDPNGVDVIALLITREGDPKNSSTQVRWTVNLAFNFDETGPFAAKIILEKGIVNVHITAESSKTAAKIQSAFPELELSLIRAGLQVKQLQVVNAPVPRGNTSNLQKSLVDTHA